MNNTSDIEDRAKKLVATFIMETVSLPTLNNSQAKKCALICTNEIIAALDLIELMESGKVVGALGQDDLQKVKEKIKSI